MNIAKLLRLGLSIIPLVIVMLLLSTCGGHEHNKVNLHAMQIETPVSRALADVSLESVLNSLVTLETPDGTNQALFQRLKDELARQLQARGTAKIASKPPTGEANRVNDLAIADNGDGTYMLSWHYRNIGDYDQNGNVGVSDITPLAQHFGEAVPENDLNRNSLQAVIDGSGNGVVDIADVTPIAVHFTEEVNHYDIEEAEAESGLWEHACEIAQSTGIGEERREYREIIRSPTALWHRVVPYDAEGNQGEPSDAAPRSSREPIIYRVSPTDGYQHEECSFSAVVSGAMPRTYSWDFGGGTTPNTSSDPLPKVTLADAGEYAASLTVTNAYGEALFPFILIVNLMPPEIVALSPTEGLENTSVQFSAEVTGTEPLTLAWEFGGGAVPDTSSDVSPIVTLTNPGEYPAMLTVMNDAGQDEYPFILTVEPGFPPDVVSVSPLTGAPGEEVIFNAELTGTPPSSYEWHFGSAVSGADTSSPNPSGTWGDEGSYTECSLTVTNAFGQDTYPFILIVIAHAETWIHSWGGVSSDVGSGVAVDGEGNVYLAGYSSSFGAGHYDALLLKYSPFGNVLWQNTWGGSAWDDATSVALDATGNAYVAGFTKSFCPEANYDAFLLKYSPSGVLLWQKAWGDTLYDEAGGVAVDESGNIYVSGWTYNSGDDAADVLVLKYSSEGSLIWQRAWGNIDMSEDMGFAIAIDSSQNVLVAGKVHGIAANTFDALLIKYSPSGDVLSLTAWGGDADDCASGVAVDQAGNAYVSGYTKSFGAGEYDFLLLKYSSSGSLLWQKVWGNAGDDLAWAVAVDSSGNVYVAGGSRSFGLGDRDAVILVYSPDGELISQRRWGEEGDDYEDTICELCVDGNDKLHLGGLGALTNKPWSNVYGTACSPDGTVKVPSGLSYSPSGSESEPIGSESIPQGAEDEVGRPYDVLLIKLDPFNLYS